MENPKTVIVVHASDADQHLGHLKKILESLKEEKRIGSYSTVDSSKVSEDSFKTLENESMVTVLLTNNIVDVKSSIETLLLEVKRQYPEVKVAEVLVDNVPYETSFIAFPTSLEPIRASEDMDGVWQDIEGNLKRLFPKPEVKPVPPPPPKLNWKKYLPYLLGLIGLIILFFGIRAFMSDDGPPPPGKFKVVKVNASMLSPAAYEGNCPHKFDFQGIIQVNGKGTVKYKWIKSDGTSGPIETMQFDKAGNERATTSWKYGAKGENSEGWQQLEIVSPNKISSNQAKFKVRCKGEVAPTGIKRVALQAAIVGSKNITASCPKQLVFKGQIKTDGAGTVRYTWERKNGSSSPVQTLNFGSASVKDVSYRLNVASSTMNDWVRLKVISPISFVSSNAQFTLNCAQSNTPTVLRHVAKSSNTSGHITTINHSSTNGKKDAILIVTQKYGVYNVNEIGVWYSNGKWKIFNQNRRAMPKNAIFNVMVVPKNSGKAFVHTTTNSNTSGHITTLNAALTNAKPNALVYVTHNYGKYDISPVGVWYSGGKWKIYNEITATKMPEGTKFNVLVLNPNENRIGNLKIYGFKYTNNSNGHISTMRTPRNFKTSANLFITQNYRNTYNPNVTGVWLSGTRWTAFNQNRRPLPRNVQFNVMVTNY